MGLFDFLGSKGSVKTTTRVTEKDNNIRVRSGSTGYDRSSRTGRHETAWSTTNYNTQTGKTSYKEGWHGSKDNKK